MLKFRYILINTLLIGAVVFLQSCVKEGFGTSEGESFNLRFYAHTPSLTKVQTASESAINQVDAMVFVMNGAAFEYAYGVQGTSITDVGGNTTTFEITLRSERRPVKIYFYMNSANAVNTSGVAIGDSENVVKSKVNLPFTSAGINGNFPMWGEYTSSVGLIPGETAQFVNLIALRSVARADVTATDVANVFNMTSVQVYRANSVMQIAPNAYSQSPMQVSSPSVPTTSVASVDTNPIVVTQNSLMEQLYIPEATSPAVANQLSDACCLVVGGSYMGNSVTYYRIDFEATLKGEILRNNLYTFNIISVEDNGWGTPDEAAKNAPVNISVTTEDWTDNVNSIGISGQNFFWIKTKIDSTNNLANSIAYFPVSTNILDYTIQWCDANGVPDGTPTFTLDNTYFSVTKGRNSVIVIAKTDNPAGSGARMSHVLIGAGRAQIVITITQPDS